MQAEGHGGQGTPCYRPWRVSVSFCHGITDLVGPFLSHSWGHLEGAILCHSPGSLEETSSSSLQPGMLIFKLGKEKKDK